MIKFISQTYLKFLAKIILKKLRPTIIAVCGSTGKSTAVYKFAKILSDQTDIAGSPKNFNAEIGVPLSILRVIPEGETKLQRWSGAAFSALKQLFILKKYPKFLILEFGMHAPSDAETLLNIAAPQICVFTNLAPSIFSHADKSEQYNKTFSYFLKRLPENTILITNADDPHLEELRPYFPAKTERIGQSSAADWKMSEIVDGETGQRFSVARGSEKYEMKIGEFGVHHAYIAAALLALAAALELDVKKTAGSIVEKYGG